MESHVLAMLEAKHVSVGVDIAILDNPSLLLDLGAKKGCNELDFIKAINILEDNEVQPPPLQITTSSIVPSLTSSTTLGMSNTIVYLISPSLEGVVDIQSSKQQSENSIFFAKALEEDYTP
jgi:hypothetical protein